MGEKDVKKTEDDERGEWSNPVEFILSCLGYAVGLGNVWRFPYLTYVNGGGAFLIPYTIMLTLVGIPVFFLELSAGQYCGGGPVTVWSSMAPIFTGVGVGMMIITFIGSIYYNMIIGWSLYYMFASWQKVLPWSTCDHNYNTAYCYSRGEEIKQCIHEPDDLNYDPSAIWFNQTCYNGTFLSWYDEEVTPCTNESEYYSNNCTMNKMQEALENQTTLRVSASEEYFNNAMLKRSPSIEETGDMQWELVLLLLLAWIMCYVCVIKGIRSSGKVVYFTATFPYLILVILLIRGALLEGALEGIKFYIIPDWSKLATAKVWVDAAGQIFFSLSVGMGGLMTFASYNKFNNNVYRDTLIVTIGNCITSFFAGFAIFSILGHLGFILKKPVSEVASSGSGLAFVAYPEVVLWLEPPQLWSTLFFFMLITLGLDSQAGVYWLELMSYYSSGWSLVLTAMAEAMIISWCYLAQNIKKDIETMVGFKLYVHWWFCWTFITPLLLLGILIFNFIDFTPLAYGNYILEDWAQSLGWLMAFASVAMIPVFAIVQMVAAYMKRDRAGYGSDWGMMLRTVARPTTRWREHQKRNTQSEEKHDESVSVPQYFAYGDANIDAKPNVYVLPEQQGHGHLGNGQVYTNLCFEITKL